MQWWIILKMIAGIIANLPFQADEPQVREAVTSAVHKVQAEVSTDSSEVGIASSEWEELIELLIPIIYWVVRRIRK